jgi:uroporphyrinogen-III decarboxylase
MTSRERVLAALQKQEPDRIPYCELGVDRSLAGRIMGWPEARGPDRNLEANRYSAGEAKAVAERLGLDNLSYVLRAPVYTEKAMGKDGRLFYGEGLIKREQDLAKLRLPDPQGDGLYEEAEEFAREKGERACFLITRIGISPTLLSMGLETFSLALYENRSFLEAVLDTYCDWTVEVARRVGHLGFDAFVSTDDMAFKTAPFFSPKVFRALMVPRLKRVADSISLPWILHSDGNIQPFVEDLVNLGVSALHPNEKGAMDIGLMKRLYGSRLCLMGNVDLNILGQGSPEEVEEEVRKLIGDIGPGGGYIVSSGNSLAAYLRPENVLALGKAVRKHGQYPLKPV